MTVTKKPWFGDSTGEPVSPYATFPTTPILASDVVNDSSVVAGGPNVASALSYLATLIAGTGVTPSGVVTVDSIALWADSLGNQIKQGPFIGVAPLNVVQLDALGKLPPIDGSQLTNLPVAAVALDDLTDVVITAPASGDLITHNGIQWVNLPPAPAGITELTGDVAAGPGSGSQATTIQPDVVTNTKLANMAQSRIKGREAGGGTGDPQDLTPDQVVAILPDFNSAARGVVPASGGGTVNYLRADGTWAPGGAPSLADQLIPNFLLMGG